MEGDGRGECEGRAREAAWVEEGRGGKKMERGVLDADWEGEEFGERIL